MVAHYQLTRSFTRLVCIVFLHIFIYGTVILANIRLVKIYDTSVDRYDLYAIDVVQICAAAALATWMLFLLADTSRLGGICTRLANVSAGYQMPTKADMVFASLVVVAGSTLLRYLDCDLLGSEFWPCTNIWGWVMALLGAYLAWIALKRRSSVQIPGGRPQIRSADKALFISAGATIALGFLVVHT